MLEVNKFMIFKLAPTKKQAQSLIEYALILAMVAVVAIAALQLLGNNIGDTLNSAANTVGQGASEAGKNACEAMGDKFTWTAGTEGGSGSCTLKTGSN